MALPTLLALALAADGPSFDCAKARAADEKLVCAEPSLAALDRDLASKYETATKRADAATAAELRRSQRAWLAERASCTHGRGGPATERTLAIRCLETSYEWRIADVERPHVSPKLPPGIVERRLVRRDPRARDSVDISYPALEPGRRGAAAFDAFFAKQAKDRAGDPHDAVVADATDAMEDDPRAQSDVTASFEVPLATPRLVTVVTEGYDYGGGAHGLPFRSATTFDLERGRPLTLDDAFAKGAAHRGRAPPRRDEAPRPRRPGMERRGAERAQGARERVELDVSCRLRGRDVPALRGRAVRRRLAGGTLHMGRAEAAREARLTAPTLNRPDRTVLEST